MGTSPPEVKAIAGYVSTTPEEGGVADVIERFVLGGEQAAVKASG
jgi:hydroxymethylpyrimidine pyrophosphatase-like HAD family hydrolase